MASATVLMSRLMSMMIMVIVGYVIVKLKIIESRDSRILSSLVVYILQPCLICRSFQIEITPERMYGFLASMIFGIIMYIVWIVVGTLFRKPFKMDGIDICTLIYGNVGNLMLPLINMMLGKNEPTPAADINGDTYIDVSDVNAVINIMLGKAI